MTQGTTPAAAFDADRGSGAAATSLHGAMLC